MVLVPSSFAYTGHGPWEWLQALKDQGEAYRRLQEQLFLTSGQRSNIVAIRTAIAPLIYAILPLGIIRWRSIGWIARISVGIVIATSVIFSIMRGTDKELADLFIVGIAAGFVAVGRNLAIGEGGQAFIQRSWKVVAMAILFMIFAQSLFTQRKEQRIGGYVSRTAVCANSSGIAPTQ